ncbi:MAG: hypothetical protein JWN33_603 [Candidatus Saccharibacteria bacterium]|nr:hypothetical protein [Candidatus Saccharibacteria bacterium]
MSRATVLVIEDEEWLQSRYQAMLEKDYDVLTAAEGQTAMELIDQRPVSVILLDMLLSVSTGLTLLHELQSYADTARIPVIIASTIADTLTIEQLQPYGVVRILDKTTMTPKDIISSIRSALA